MGITTGQQITTFYNKYKDIDVTFTKGVIQATGLVPSHVFLKCLGDQWPAVIYSCSMLGAKIVVNARSSLYETIRKANNLVSLRFSFKLPDKNDPLFFFVSAKIGGFNPYSKENPDLNFVNLQFTQRPPDDLIEILGNLLEANINSKKRKEERIIVTQDSLRKLGFKGKDALLYIQGVPRKCIIRDVSFSGAKVIIAGVAKFLVEKKATLKIEIEENRKVVDIEGTILRYEEVEGRKDLAALAIKYDEDKVPMEYKIRINDYLRQIRKSAATQTDQKINAEEKKANNKQEKQQEQKKEDSNE